MITIWKFQIPGDSFTGIDMPQGSQLLSLGVQYDRPVVWAMVDDEREFVLRGFRVARTGHDLQLPDDAKYVGTCQLNHGKIVRHIFDLGEK